MRAHLPALGSDSLSLVRTSGRPNEQLQFELTYLKFNLVAPHGPRSYLGLSKFIYPMSRMCCCLRLFAGLRTSGRCSSSPDTRQSQVPTRSSASQTKQEQQMNLVP